MTIVSSLLVPKLLYPTDFAEKNVEVICRVKLIYHAPTVYLEIAQQTVISEWWSALAATQSDLFIFIQLVRTLKSKDRLLRR